MMETKECQVRFGKYIKSAREAKGLYQKDIAESIGIAQSYLSDIENGKKPCFLELAIKICVALSLDLNDFIKQFID